jgi:capsular polysaccharide biosynthesis protein
MPPLTGFTTMHECVKAGNSVRFALDEGDSHQFVISLPNAMVVNAGAIVTREGALLQDTQVYNPDPQGLLRGNLPSKELFLHEKVAVIASTGQENWYHWLLQILPRLKILAESSCEFDKVYVGSVCFAWQHESLKAVCDALNIPEDKLLIIDDDIVIHAKELIVPSVPFIPSEDRKILPAWLKDFIGTTFLARSSLTDVPSKIYISRLRASCRRISNEDELVRLLKKYGFVTLHLEDLSVFDQAHIFQNAEVIVGPHGSGFTNLIFSRPGTMVVEIDHGLEGQQQRSFYKRFAALMDCRYIPFYVDQVSEGDLEKDLIIDVNAFDALLSNIVEKS